MYLAIRSDKSMAEVYLLGATAEVIAEKVWGAERTLARDLPGVIDELLNHDYSGLKGVIVYRGPGSFTGLRIGASVGNAISYGRDLPIVGTTGDDWRSAGATRLANGRTDKIVVPEYGAAPHITLPKH